MNRIAGLLGLILLSPWALPKNLTPAGLPAIIDRELLFGNPEITGAQLSPDGKFIALYEALERNDQHLGKEDRGALLVC